MITKYDPFLQAWLEDGQKIRKQYQEQIQEEGLLSPKSLGDRADDSREIAFFDELVAGFHIGEAVSILDIGCGKGEFIRYCRETHPTIDIKEYLGVEVVPEFMDLAIKDYPEYSFQLVNFIDPLFASARKYDLVIALGVLVSRVRWYEEYIECFVDKMLGFSSKYVSFNIISDISQGSPNYIDPQKVARSTNISLYTIENILSKMKNVEYKLNTRRIFSDAEDTFVQITKR